ncbi:DNA repair protein RecO [Devosia insulae DS-56]|uniref:DNA repair protein RecO n=1 Tax=Devosia insulae DS-56 TaxID=1116389 RepID=A0A1E5XIC6_9HYPH|nr:DNA repair protein RecO [Devosia insulae]OEO28264.1 DNA repair protein RecO [Devosia insulae DS-56]
MQWDGEGLIVGVRRHGESSVIAEVMVEGRGRHLGLIRGGRSSKLAATLQPGNSVQVSWRARLEEHLGTFTLELLEARAAGLIADQVKLYASQIVCEHLRLLPERDPHDRLLGLAIRILDQAGSVLELGASVARFELILLDELGFGLDLSSCAATGTNRDLTHVSPKSGRAVSRTAAEPYLSRLLRLPQFLISSADPTPEDVGNAFALTGHFLDMHVWLARQLEPPAIRETFIELVSKPTD